MEHDAGRPTERQNVVVMSVRLSKRDAELCQQRAAKLGVGVSTYIRMIVRQHLSNEGAYDGPFVGDAWKEVAAARETPPLAPAPRRRH